jgi:hypothetical protein
MGNIDRFYQCSVAGQGYLSPQDIAIWQLRCHLRIFFLSSGEQIVLISDLGCEISWFVPHRLELLATQIVADFHLNPDRLIWIEHDPAGTEMLDKTALGIELSQVIFQWQDGKATNPQWYDLSPQIIAVLRREMLQMATV